VLLHDAHGNVRSIGISDVALIVWGPMRVPATGVIGTYWLVIVIVTMQPTLFAVVQFSVTPGGAA
jgi:hypothetical protein